MNLINDEQKEACAVLLMRSMLTDYCTKNNIPFETAFFSLASSPAYKALFDYETGLWKEGPIYLREFWLATMKKK